jgi:hypothetical protein
VNSPGWDAFVDAVLAAGHARAGRSRARTDFGADPAVRRDPARRDWIELALRSPADLDRLGPLLAIAVAANG